VEILEYIHYPIFTVQFHPEMDEKTGNQIYKKMNEKIQKEGIVNERVRLKLFENFIAKYCEN
jgi:GMP synthase-like glutamine amidotransferase